MDRKTIAVVASVAIALLSAAESSAQSLEATLPAKGIEPCRLGDVDLDGRADLLVTAQIGWEPGLAAPEARVFSSAGWNLLYKVQAPPFTGGFASVDSTVAVGDIDLDGRPDFVVGAQGEVVVAGQVYGSVRAYTGANGTLLHFVPNPGAIENHFGAATAAAGDVDGDGRPDYAVAGPGGGATLGRVYVFAGANGQLLRTYAGFGTSGSFQFGESIDNAGDVDLDGFVDLLANEDQIGPWQPAADGAHVFSGATGARLYFAPPPPGAYPGNWIYGETLRSVGDVDTDGVADFAAQHYPISGSWLVHVYSGALGAPLYSLAGPVAFDFDFYGWDIDTLGDVDADGADDFLVNQWFKFTGGKGAIFGHSGATGKQIFHLFHPSADDNTLLRYPTNLGDVDADGQIEIGVGASIAGVPGTIEIWSPFGDLAIAYPAGCTGAGGFTPAISGSFSGSNVQLSLSGGLGGSFAVLLLGNLPNYAPPGVSCTIAVSNTYPFLPLIPLGGSGPGAGSFSFAKAWPTGLDYLFLQAFVADPTTPRGYSASNGLELALH